ncbi:MAG: metal-dependent hydrolase [Planctomycetota bacterium]|nr:metal-dependent hydrolase [Planctomycetota bacterium]
MDPVTQTALGATLAMACSRPERQRRAALAGGIGGLIPDADVFLRSAQDPLLFLEYHRHFTHALLFIPVGALIAASLAWLVGRGRSCWRSLWWPAFLGYATHGLLDAGTSYGTRLYWPFSDARVAWGVIAILDPLFSVPLLVGVVVGTRRRRRGPPVAALTLALAYLGMCAVQQVRAAEAQADLIAARGQAAMRREAKPSILTNFVFRSFYEVDGVYHVDAIRVPWFGRPEVIEGTQVPVLDLVDYQRRFHLSPLQLADVERFRHFSNGYLIEDPRHPGVIGDLRYAALPDAVAPLWGIDPTGKAPEEHLAYRTFRGLGPRERERWLDLVLGHTGN